MWAITSRWRPNEFWYVKTTRRDVHNYLLRLWFQPEDYDTQQQRTKCLKKIGRGGIRAVKVKIVLA